MSFIEQHQSYHRTAPIIGIYVITNNINNKKYVGKSNNILRRFTEHKNPSEQKQTPNKPLYLAFNKYGIENFSFDVLEECPIEQLNEKEKYWIAKLDTANQDKGYNILLGGDGHNPDDLHPNHKVTREDVIDIRTRYNDHERKKDVEALYAEKIGPSGFKKIWQGITWSDIMPEVYTPENKYFHAHNTGNKGSANGRALVNEKMVKEIRQRKINGETVDEVYKDYAFTGIKKTAFYEIWQNYKWTHVTV